MTFSSEMRSHLLRMVRWGRARLIMLDSATRFPEMNFSYSTRKVQSTR